ncbi:helix-turn-helix domain-containing protein, partial [Alphaproteobacteria bacterium]|nr:helix-turn-helix domain-containing protein [Alphaproteobacteria bacterium]
MNRQIDLGSRLKSIRKQKGWNQSQFAEKLGMSVEAVSNLERNINRPSFATLEKLCEVTGLTLGDLFSFDQSSD